jgi:predicted dehydrogenase
MKRIKIAQIGMNQNSHGKDIMDTLRKYDDLYEVVGYALPERERERMPDRLACFEGLPEMTVEEILADPTIEAVTVETDEIYLTKYARMAAEAGKHIHMEKPGGREVADFEKLIDTVKQKDTVLHLGYMYRYNPYIIELLEQVRRGELGKIISVEAQMNCIHPPALRNWLKALPGGMMFYLGCHLIDLILQIQGMPEEIIPLNVRTGLGGAEGEDFGMAILRYPSGISFAKTSAVEVGGFRRRQLVVAGENKTVELKPFEYYEGPLLYTDRTTYTVHDWNTDGTHDRTDGCGRYDAMMQAFAAMVRGERENPCTPDYELMLYRTVLRCCGV